MDKGDVKELKKIAVRSPQWLGDAVVSTIFIRHLKAKYPESEIHVLVKPKLADIFNTHPDVTGVVLLPHPYGWNVQKAGRSLRSQNFDAIYVLPRSTRTALEALSSGIPVKIGFKGNLRSLFFSDTVPYDAKKKYPLRYLDLIGGPVSNQQSLQGHFPQREISDTDVLKFIGASETSLPPPILGMAPISVAPARTWSGERFATLANRFIKETGGSVFLLGAPNERERLDQIKQQIEGPAFVESGQIAFPELGGVMSKFSCFVGNDSGLMHVAAALKIPSVIVFGASDPNAALPIGENITSVERHDLFCAPCVKNNCVRFGAGRNECLKLIGVDDLWKKVSFLLGRN